MLIVCCTSATFAWRALLRSKVAPRIALALYAIAAAIAISFPYVSTTDAYAYALYGYEAGIARVSPYKPARLGLAGGSDFALLDRLFPGEHSGVRICNYGPIFVAAYASVARISQGSLRTAIVLERLLSAAALLVLALSLRRVVLVALCPFAIFELIAFAHTDALMLVLLGAAWAAYRRNLIAISCAAIVLAGEVKGIALLAFVPLAFDLLARRESRTALAAVVGTAGTFGVTAAMSVWLFGTFSLGASPAVAPYSSPGMLLATLAGGSLTAIKIFGGAQLVAGLSLAAWLFSRRRPELGASAAMASLPALFPWYLSWLMPIAAVTRNRRFVVACIAAASVAILGEVNLLVADTGLVIAALVLAATWSIPVLAYARAANSDARAPERHESSYGRRTIT